MARNLNFTNVRQDIVSAQYAPSTNYEHENDQVYPWTGPAMISPGSQSSQSNLTDASVYLRPFEAATCLRLSKSTLAKWQLSGKGPPYCKVGRAVVYRRQDFDAWLGSRQFQNTPQTLSI